MGVIGMRISIIVSIAICLTPVVYTVSPGTFPGTATYYPTPYTPSACYGEENNGTMIAAANDEIFNDKAGCGLGFLISCTGPTNQGVLHPCTTGETIFVQIVDHCLNCDQTFSLSVDAFAKIAVFNAGTIAIDFTQ